MSRLLAALTLVATSALFPQPVITSVTPSSGPSGGGTAITIRGSGFAAPCPPVPQPCGRRTVTIGPIEAASFRPIDDNTIEAATSPNFPGLVSVGLSTPAGASALRDSFTYTGEITDAFERILLPLYVPLTQGAFGSRFTTELSLWQTSGPDIPLFGVGYDCCCILCPSPPPIHITVLKARFGSPTGNFTTYGDPGLLVWVPKDAFSRMAATLRATDLSRQSESWGTTIPVVPEREFRNDFLALLDVPLTPGFRDTLRIYALDPETSVHIRIIRSDSTRMYLELDAAALRNPADLFHPGYAQVSDFGTVPPDRVRIEVVPDKPGKRIWAFVSVTNNATQQITVITPH